MKYNSMGNWADYLNLFAQKDIQISNKSMKRYLNLLVIKEIQVKTTM